MEGTLAHGAVIARRYRLQDRLDDVDGAEAWRAVDEVLGRGVVLHILAFTDPRADRVARAAREAALVHDPRFLRVLDAAAAGDHLYVVREWVAGRNLATVLSAGALPPATAALLAREVAEAVSAAHAQGLRHLALDPTTVIVADDGAVKVTGLATEAAFRGLRPADPVAEDALGIGRILYAGLTGRWPGPSSDLPPAPLVDGRLASPRQVRAGVPRDLDEVADRILGSPPRHGPPLRDPRAVADALVRTVPVSRGLAHLVDFDDPESTQPAAPVVDSAGAGASRPTDRSDTSPPDAPARRPTPARRTGERRMSRVVGVVAGLLLLVGLALVGWQLLTAAFPAVTGRDTAKATPLPESPLGSPTATTGRALKAVAAHDFDPAADPPSENPQSVDRAIDGDPSTSWSTMTYYDPLTVTKPGVGLYVDLGSVQDVRSVRLALVGSGSVLQVRAAPEGAAAPTQLDGWRLVGSRSGAGENIRLTFDATVRTRYLLVWFTKLPTVPGGFRVGVAEVGVRS